MGENKRKCNKIKVLKKFTFPFSPFGYYAATTTHPLYKNTRAHVARSPFLRVLKTNNEALTFIDPESLSAAPATLRALTNKLKQLRSFETAITCAPFALT